MIRRALPKLSAHAETIWAYWLDGPGWCDLWFVLTFVLSRPGSSRSHRRALLHDVCRGQASKVEHDV